ncbi:MAG: hypothetical protein K1Y02_19075 [Candidatus Hydrogenedentes bacterium]|nr:hypothetical protein [Candidatus Hydrogenedentota bacterium]
MSSFLFSAHKNIECITCHPGAAAHVQSGGLGGDLINPANGPLEASFSACAGCHESQVTEYVQSVHYTSRRVACYDCHDVHSPLETKGPFKNNLLCISCHVADGFTSNAAVEQHTFHPVDPSGTGESRCTLCHMPPKGRTDQDDGPHDHTFATLPPSYSADAANNGVTPVPPNSCAGTIGCHDGTTPNTPVFDVDDPAQMNALQAIYDFWFTS